MILSAATQDPGKALEALLQNWPELLVGGLVWAFLVGMLVYAAVLYFKRLRHNWRTRWLAGVYVGAALPAGVISLVFMMEVMLSKLASAGDKAALVRPALVVCMAIGGVIGLAVEIFKGLVYTGSGEMLSRRIGQPSFPCLRGWLRERRRRLAGRDLPGTRVLPWPAVLLASVAVVGYTALLFWATDPRVSSLIKVALPHLDREASSLGLKLLSAWLVTLLAIKEEIVFRLFLQSAFTWWLRRVRDGWWWAILLSATVWTLAHAGMVEPAWVKYAQILPIGILLGLMRRRWGLESTIVVHVLLNLAAVFVLEGLCQR